jgi:Fuc2NAc and GlcNAc transferase
MDGIDGIAGITSVVGFGLIGLWTFLYGEDTRWAVLALCIAVASSGFLIFNLPKAKVFMGDISSTFLGFLFGAFVFFFSTSPPATLCLFSFLLPFYVDELTTMTVRVRDGENLTVAHRRHVYQLLANEKGIAHWKVSMGYGVVQLMVGLSILSLYTKGIVAVAGLLLLFFAVLVFVSFDVRKRIESSGSAESV